MEEIVTSVKQVAAIMTEISMASQEQRAGIEQVNQAVTQMDEMTQQNSALVEEAAAAAADMRNQASKLAELVGTFKLVAGASAATLENQRARDADIGRPIRATPVKRVSPKRLAA